MDPVNKALNDAADLLEQPGAWTQQVVARDSLAFETDPNGPTAKSFCIVGALLRVAQNLRVGRQAEIKLTEKLQMPVPVWNDFYERTQAEVVAALRAAAIDN